MISKIKIAIYLLICSHCSIIYQGEGILDENCILYPTAQPTDHSNNITKTVTEDNLQQTVFINVKIKNNLDKNENIESISTAYKSKMKKKYGIIVYNVDITYNESDTLANIKEKILNKITAIYCKNVDNKKQIVLSLYCKGYDYYLCKALPMTTAKDKNKEEKKDNKQKNFINNFGSIIWIDPPQSNDIENLNNLNLSSDMTYLSTILKPIKSYGERGINDKNIDKNNEGNNIIYCYSKYDKIKIYNEWLKYLGSDKRISKEDEFITELIPFQNDDKYKYLVKYLQNMVKCENNGAYEMKVPIDGKKIETKDKEELADNIMEKLIQQNK